jgi:hypothetical protein
MLEPEKQALRQYSLNWDKMYTLRLHSLLLRGILDVNIVIWEEHSKNFGYISYYTTVEILENFLNIDAR